MKRTALENGFENVDIGPPPKNHEKKVSKPRASPFGSAFPGLFPAFALSKGVSACYEIS
jgi:hypothetical protein